MNPASTPVAVKSALLVLFLMISTQNPESVLSRQHEECGEGQSLFSDRRLLQHCR